MKVGKKYRGPFEKCLLSYVKDRLDGRDDLVKDRIFVTHTPCDAKTVEAVKKSVKQYGGFSQVVETQAGCTISSHCGPNTLGCLLYTSKEKSFGDKTAFPKLLCFVKAFWQKAVREIMIQ